MVPPSGQTCIQMNIMSFPCSASSAVGSGAIGLDEMTALFEFNVWNMSVQQKDQCLFTPSRQIRCGCVLIAYMCSF